MMVKTSQFSTRSPLHHTKRRRRLAATLAILLLYCCWDDADNPSAFHFFPTSLQRHHRRYHPFSTYRSLSLSSSRSARGSILVNRSTRIASPKEQDDNTSIGNEDDEAVARPTPNGGFTHTRASRAKISAANTGRIPWNKGKQRTEETKRKIAQGVQRRNHERLLQKLAAMNMTEAEYIEMNERKEQERNATRLARLTANGGYKLTEETKQKISRILKQRFKEGKIKHSPRNPNTIRRGFTHSEETRRKISDTLKIKWATDKEYRNLMLQTTHGSHNKEVNQRISATLRAKWQDPSFREYMLQKLKYTDPNNSGKMQRKKLDEAHRRKISESIKAKWQDDTYRLKIVSNRTKAIRRVPNSTRTMRNKIVAVEPMSVRRIISAPRQRITLPAVKTNNFFQPVEAVPVKLGQHLMMESNDLHFSFHDQEKTYDDEDEEGDELMNGKHLMRKTKSKEKLELIEDAVRSDLYDLLFDDDESLDEFDPYGLENN